MAIAGAGIPTLKLWLDNGVLRQNGGTTWAPVGITFSQWGQGMGDLSEAAQRLKQGATVRIDARGDSYRTLRNILHENQ